jgi:hypothetical protein
MVVYSDGRDEIRDGRLFETRDAETWRTLQPSRYYNRPDIYGSDTVMTRYLAIRPDPIQLRWRESEHINVGKLIHLTQSC